MREKCAHIRVEEEGEGEGGSWNEAQCDLTHLQYIEYHLEELFFESIRNTRPSLAFRDCRDDQGGVDEDNADVCGGDDQWMSRSEHHNRDATDGFEPGCEHVWQIEMQSMWCGGCISLPFPRISAMSWSYEP